MSKLFSPTVLDRLRRRPDLGLAEWAERYRVVNGGPFPGRWRNETFPPQREIADAFDDVRVRRVVVAACMRSGKTEAALINPLLRAIQRGEPVLYMTTTDVLTENTWRQKILPALRSEPELRGLLLGAREAGDSNVRYFAGGGQIHFCTAQSIGKLVGFDASLILLDEVDKYPPSLRGEASPAELAVARGAAFRDRLKVAEVCTVTKESGRIWQQFLAGDRRRLQVPCPFCGRWQVLYVATNDGVLPASAVHPLEREGRGGLRWSGQTPREIERTAHYVCPFCSHHISEAERRKIVLKARFVPEGQEIRGGKLRGKPSRETDVASFWFSDLYLPWSSWSYLASEIQDAENREDVDKQKAIVQQYLALPWYGSGVGVQELSAASVAARLSGVPAGVVPDDADRVIAFMDIGARRCWWVVTAWGKGAKGYIIDYGVEDVFGAPEGNLAQKSIGRAQRQALELAVLTVLRDWRDRLIQRPYVRANGEPVPISLTLVDAGYLDNVVVRFCRESGQRHFMASRGYGAGHGMSRKPTGGGKNRVQGNNWAVTLLADGKSLQFWYGADYWKSFLALRLSTEAGGQGSVELFGKESKKHFALSKHLTAETFNAEKGVWENKRKRPNHWLDCLAGCCAGADMRGRGLFSGEKKKEKEN